MSIGGAPVGCGGAVAPGIILRITSPFIVHRHSGIVFAFTEVTGRLRWRQSVGAVLGCLPEYRSCPTRDIPRSMGVSSDSLVSFSPTNVNPRKLEHGFKMICAGIPYTLPSGHEENDVPTFWPLL